MSVRFSILPADASVVALFQRELGLPSFIATTLAARGMRTVEEVRDFLDPSLDRDWLDPYLIPGLAEVVDGLEEAVKEGERIVVFGDFDLDGISATVTLTRALRILGADALPFIPHRGDEGYGLTAAAIERMRATLDPRCVITVDCGIACRLEVDMLVDAGLRVLVSDHHEPSDLVPLGIPVADPKLSPECPSGILAGVGVALKIVQALGARFGQPHLWRDYTDLATLGTVADLMPMRGENRALVSDGVGVMNASPRPCLAALLAASGASGKRVAADNLSFSIIPRLNAAGRMGDAGIALDLLLADEFGVARAKAEELEAVNDLRRSIEAELVEMASVQAAEIYRGQRALIVAGEGWHEGVKGIVASRLVRSYGVPSLLFTIDPDGNAHGSGRSVGQVNLFKALESVSDLLIRFGGHEAAVGLTLPVERLSEFTERLCSYMDGLPAESFHPRVKIDACVALDELTLENVGALQCLAPFGQENPQPRYLARNISLANCRAVGAEKNHFSCSLTDGRQTVAGIMFHCSDIETLMHCESVINAAFEVQVDEWRGRRSVKAMLSSLAPAEPCAALEACLDGECLGFVEDLYATDDAELCADHRACAAEVEAYEASCESNRALWEARAAKDPEGLQEAIVPAFIGERELFESQRSVLEALGEGISTLAVMVTGRGKSLTFQVYAATEALLRRKTSLFVYPLRALIADQSFHLNEALERFGVSSSVLTGESTPEERRTIFAQVGEGACDIVLTTPEFLSYHAHEFPRGAIDFVVIDEAHHIGLARAGHRSAYADLGQALETLGSPTVLALTATADSAIADAIMSTLSIEHCVFDESSRENLRIDDQRNLRKRNDYLANLVADGEKTVIYVNSRERSVALARMLRKRVPQMAPLVGFYNAGLSRAERTRVEEMFRTGALCALVSTSAFGEGVNIPDIRHVVLYHLPFNEIEFNQMSGRAGRDGLPAAIHLLFGRADAGINERLLREATPGHDDMAQVYRYLRDRQRDAGDASFATNPAEVAREASSKIFDHSLTPASALCSIAVFRELGLIETRSFSPDESADHRIRVVEADGKVELTDSVRYREGLDEIEIFHAFEAWAMNASPAVLRRRVARPILPGDDRAEGRKGADHG